MFKELLPVLRQRSVLITVTHLANDELRVNVIPQKVKEGDNDALTTPVTLTGEAEHLDAELPRTLVEYVGSHLQLSNTLARAKQEMEAASKAAQAEARSKSKGASKSGSVEEKASGQDLKEAAPEPKKNASPTLFDGPSSEDGEDEESEILAELNS